MRNFLAMVELNATNHHTFHFYRKLALEERSVSGLMGEVTARYREHLQEAREAFYLTLDRYS